MWASGDAKPSPPSPEACYSLEAFFYTDESGCWEEWDEYCLPNWDNDEECLAVTLDFVDSLGQTVTDATVSGTPPAEACFYEDAYYYRDDSTCEASWREWDSYCSGQREEDVRCAETEVAYAAAIATAAREVVIPGVECFTIDAWNYRDGGVCSETWRSFDAWCGDDASDADRDLCDTVNGDYSNCVNNEICESSLDENTLGEDTIGEDTIGVSPPGEDCFYKEAFYYEEESACE